MRSGVDYPEECLYSVVGVLEGNKEGGKPEWGLRLEENRLGQAVSQRTPRYEQTAVPDESSRATGWLTVAPYWGRT